jgi:hypothetical protein
MTVLDCFIYKKFDYNGEKRSMYPRQQNFKILERIPQWGFCDDEGGGSLIIFGQQLFKNE